METFFSSFLCAGGPLLVICFLIGWVPYFLNSPLWNDANIKDPIKLGLKSPLYTYASVAGISASIPPCLELIFYLVVSRGNSVKRTTLILTNMIIFISPELISLILVSPFSDSKLYFLLLNNRIIASFFFAMLMLCQFSEKTWRCKLSTVTVTLIYVGSLFNCLAPYFNDITEIWIQKSGTFLMFIGCLLFVIKSCKFLGTNSLAKESEDFMIVDDLLCKFITLSVLFIITSMFCVYLSAGFPYWTQWNSTYITSYTMILTLPNVLMGVAFAHATRNETVYLQHAKQMFINYISHEMRTPLNTAVMGLQHLRSELVKADANDEILTTLEEVRSSCETSVTILSEMLDFDKLQSGLMKLDLEEVTVKDLLEDTISPFFLQAGLKDITIECSLNTPALQHLLVYVDKSKFAQVIRNLLSNALKFTPIGGTIQIVTVVTPYPTLLSSHTATVAVAGAGSSSTIQKQSLMIAVTDSGAGISKENQKKLFKKMVQFNPGKLQSGGGSGLGLYSIMDLHHGNLSVRSEGEGHGCTFTAYIQAAYVDKKVHIESLEHNVAEVDEEGQLGPAELTNNNDNCGRILRSSSMGANTNRFRNSRISGSIRSIGSTSAKVTPILRCNSASFSARGSICAQLSQEEGSGGSIASGTADWLKILVVDDSKSNRKMLMRVLRDRCAVMGEAIDGVDAVNQIKELFEEEEPRQYDAILMDFIMPNMEGPEAVQIIRELGYKGLIIGITGNVLPVDKERFIRHGADLVFTKPVNITDIVAALSKLAPPPTPFTNVSLTTTITTTNNNNPDIVLSIVI